MLGRWDIVQVQPAGSPGAYRVWAMVGDEMFVAPVRVPRRFYVEVKGRQER